VIKFNKDGCDWLLNTNGLLFNMNFYIIFINININDLLTSHENSGKIATITAVYPPARFGALNISGSNVISFKEKPTGIESLINGGYFVFNKEIFSYLLDDATILERSPLEELSNGGELNAYIHESFWQSMDTLRDKVYLEQLWNQGAPWKVW
jgi:glucose-1-phosphate cytidylyltransferase